MVSWMTLWLASEHVGRSFAHEREGIIDGGLSDAEVGQPGGSRLVLGGKNGYESWVMSQLQGASEELLS